MSCYEGCNDWVQAVLRTQDNIVHAAGHAASMVGAAGLALALLLLPPHVHALAPEHAQFRSHAQAM